MILDLFKKEPTQEQTIPTKTTKKFIENIKHLIN
jgi:hypothetical protein